MKLFDRLQVIGGVLLPRLVYLRSFRLPGRGVLGDLVGRGFVREAIYVVLHPPKPFKDRLGFTVDYVLYDPIGRPAFQHAARPEQLVEVDACALQNRVVGFMEVFVEDALLLLVSRGEGPRRIILAFGAHVRLVVLEPLLRRLRVRRIDVEQRLVFPYGRRLLLIPVGLIRRLGVVLEDQSPVLPERPVGIVVVGFVAEGLDFPVAELMRLEFIQIHSACLQLVAERVEEVVLGKPLVLRGRPEPARRVVQAFRQIHILKRRQERLRQFRHFVQINRHPRSPF